jgi:putative (di)nucleoside polyphosphate hydrolase
MASSYRTNVAAILRSKDGKILVAERVNFKHAWQFPQGGVDKGEDLVAAMYREVQEEIGVAREFLKIVECRTGYRYKFPNHYLKKGKFCGQEQTYFLCDFLGKNSMIDLTRQPQEFRKWKWIKPKKFKIEWVPQFKQPVFRRVMRDFFGVRLRRKMAARKKMIEVPPPGVPKKPFRQLARKIVHDRKSK